MKTLQLRRGYTLIEVMMAITMLTIGASGVMAMQKASVQGNQDARDVDQGTAIAREWMDRIKRDATLWTPSDNGPLTNRGQATLLDDALTSHAGAWYIPAARAIAANSQNDFETAGFDMLGRDVPPANWKANQGALGATDYAATPGVRYCTNIRVTQLAGDGSMARVEVRVFWPQMLLSATSVADFCSTLPVDTDTTTFHFINLVSAVRMNVQP